METKNNSGAIFKNAKKSNEKQPDYRGTVNVNGKESAWNPKAVNGSHYGIPQGRSVWLRDQDGYSQVRWGLSYIEHRYSTPCNALDHWKEKNWH